MGPTVMFFAWTSPAFAPGSPVDHTWVTTYDNRIQPYPDFSAVSAAGESYWSCWGSFHASGGIPGNPTGFLGRQRGNLALAQCLVAHNRDSRVVAAARGTIFTYGVDGVCHQLANQVLYATGGGNRAATVMSARGYVASSFIYGTYGLQPAAWAANIASCGGTSVPSPGNMGPSGMTVFSDVPDAPDDFEERARSVLHDDPETLARLSDLRAQVRSFSMQRFPGSGAPSAATLNARNQHMLDEAARLLGREKFEELFGYPPDQPINLVDPTVSEVRAPVPPTRSAS